VGACFFGKVPSILWVKTWEEVLELLREEWKNKANVAVYPDGTIQYFNIEGSKQ
jgi:ligand-binding sensor domain-containing protein